MGYGKCKMCGEYHFDYEKCPPIFQVFLLDGDGKLDGLDGTIIRANNFSEASEKYAKNYNEDNEYSLVNDGDGIDMVIIDKGGNIKRFNVTAEPDIYYNGREIEEVL